MEESKQLRCILATKRLLRCTPKEPGFGSYIGLMRAVNQSLAEDLGIKPFRVLGNYFDTEEVYRMPFGSERPEDQERIDALFRDTFQSGDDGSEE